MHPATVLFPILLSLEPSVSSYSYYIFINLFDHLLNKYIKQPTRHHKPLSQSPLYLEDLIYFIFHSHTLSLQFMYTFLYSTKYFSISHSSSTFQTSSLLTLSYVFLDIYNKCTEYIIFSSSYTYQLFILI